MKPSDDDKRNKVDFNDIVERDTTYYEQHSSQLFIGSLIESLPFRIGVLLAIVMNSIVVGLQTNKYLAARYEAVFLGLDRFFHALFAVEISLKWYHDFLGFWRVGWNIFDFVIIGTSFLVPGVSFISGSRILHVLRVLQAMRSLRSISTLRGLQIVIQTVLYSIPDVAYVMALLLICIYICAILGNAIFGNDCPQNFGTVELTMFSLFVCITQDGWLKIAMELNQCGHQILGPIYLVLFITIGAFIFANLVVAVVVTNLEEHREKWERKELVIAEKNEVEKKLTHLIKKDAAKLEGTETVVKKYNTLFKKVQSQKPLVLNTKPLDKYSDLNAALQVNFLEFLKLKEELVKIQQEIRALDRLDEVTNDELLDSIVVPLSQSRQRRPSQAGGGDVITEMFGLVNKSPVQAKSIHHMITQLAQEPTDHFPAHRASLLVHEYTGGRRPSQLDSDLYTGGRRGTQLDPDLLVFQRRASEYIGSSRRSSIMTAGHRPSSAGHHSQHSDDQVSTGGRRVSSGGSIGVGHRRVSSGSAHLSSDGRRVSPGTANQRRLSSSGPRLFSGSVGQRQGSSGHLSSSSDNSALQK